MALHALYRQRQINLFAPIGYLLLQLPIFIGIYQVVSRIGKDAMATLSSDSIYGFVGNLDWMKQIAAGSQQFSGNFLGIDLTSRAWSSEWLDSGGYDFSLNRRCGPVLHHQAADAVSAAAGS